MLKILVLLTLIQVTVQHVENNNNVQNNISDFLFSQQEKNIVETMLNSNEGSSQILQNLISTLFVSNDGFLTDDLLSIVENLPLISEFFSQLRNQDINILNLFTTVFKIIDPFGKFDGDHSGHDWFLPPILEKFHHLYEIVINSPLGNKIFSNIKESNFYKTFAHEIGTFNIGKLGDLLENHSFRKRWIDGVTSTIAQIVVRILDPNLRISLLTFVQGQINNGLKMEGFPKSSHLNINEPVESVTSFINYSFRKYIGYNVQSKKYVKMFFDTLKNFNDNVLFGGQLRTEDLSNTFTHVINMEVIEPLARTYRAFRFAKKHQECDRYVMCLINNYSATADTKLPIIKETLTRVSSLLSIWFLTGYTNTPFYKLIMAAIQTGNCKDMFYKTCDGFHHEEIRVTRGYTHYEL